MSVSPPREGGLKKPTRHPLPWDDPLFYDEADFEKELRRVADICHSCRRCFNLCTSFPKLFDAIDNSKTGEVDSLTRTDFQPTIDACTLCDMCFMVKCPYVPPHPFNVDFPHLMLRARAIAAKKRGVAFMKKQLTDTDRNGRIGCHVAGVANWTLNEKNKIARPLMEKITGVDRRAALPLFASRKAQRQAFTSGKANPEAPSFGEKVVLYATCLGTYHKTDLLGAAQKVLAHNGVAVETVYPACCGMPRFEQGCVADVAQTALHLTEKLLPWVRKGYTIVSLVPSCTLLMAHEWPLLHPKNKDVKNVSAAIQDMSAYLMKLHSTKGLAAGLKPIAGGITLHMACHSRAQNQGKKAAELLQLIPDTTVHVIERCSGHGGSWGIFKGNFEEALKVGKPVMRKIKTHNTTYAASECPLASDHLRQGYELNAETAQKTVHTNNISTSASHTATEQPAARQSQPIFTHPLEILEISWGLTAPA